MKDKSKLTAIILVVLVIIVVIVTSFYNKNDKINENEISIVTNYSNFYTVNSCLYRFITYLSSNDRESLILVLDDNYEKNQKVTIENVMEFLPRVDSDSTFTSKKMYYEKLNNNITKYYVYGNIEKNLLYENGTVDNYENKDVYFIVYLDSTSKTFSVEPYSGKIFTDGEEDE